MRPYIPVLEEELAYETSAQHADDCEYWYNSLAKSSEPIFTDYMLDSRLKKQRLKNPDQRFADIHSGLPDADIMKFSLDAAESRKIYRYGKKSFAVIDKKVKKSYTIANSMFKQREGGSCALPRTKEGEK
jgi:hypothetical protein